MLVLIADDNPEMRRVIRQYLESLHPGLDVLECADGGEAMLLYARHRPGLVLMDIRMEPTDGLAATAGITQQNPNAQVCIVTNFDDQDLRYAARDAGARGYVTKDRLTDLSRYLSRGDVPPGARSSTRMALPEGMGDESGTERI